MEQIKKRVILFGASAVSKWTATFALELGFHVVVLDNEEDKLLCPEFKNCERHLVDFENLGNLGITEDDMLCVITRGHSFDRQSLVYALNSPAFYVGMLGKPSKNEKCRAYAAQQGCSAERIASVYAPIGEDIKAISVAEIGLAIAAQLVHVYNERNPREKDHEELHAD